MARTILVVDDETTLRETLVDALEAEGFQVVAAADGREALTRFRADRPDLVLLDLMLPELSGVEVCRIIRAESSVPIIMLTAKDSELDKVVGLELGADDYVTKPFSLRELTARIRALFRRAEQAVALDGPPAVVDLGSVQADLGGHRLLRDGVVVPLKPKAFELLAFLIRHPGQVFTRDQLLEHVWGYDYGGETRTVDVHVHWLRTRLEDAFVTPFDREDIHELVSRVDDVVDGIQSIAEAFVIFGVTAPTDEARRLAAILDDQGVELAAALRKLNDLKDIERHLTRIHLLEKEADGLSRAALGRMFREDWAPIDVIKWRDLYNDFENTIDAAEDAAEAMERMHHKAS